jgi:hypothetical protein
VAEEALRLLDDPPRAGVPHAPPRRAQPLGDPAARLPTPADVRATPFSLDATDELLRRTAAAAVLGWLARRGDPAAVADWRREVARAAGLAHLRAAALRRARGTWISYRRERLHLRQAYRAGYRLRAGTRRLLLSLRPKRRLVKETDALRH